MKKKWMIRLVSRRILVILLMALELVLIIFLFVSQSQISKILNLILYIFGIFVAIGVMSKNKKGSYKLLWVFLILLVPIFGAVFYVLFTNQLATRKFGKKITQIERDTKSHFYLPGDALEKAENVCTERMPQISYLQNCGFPVYADSDAEYFSPGERFFERLLPELEKAEHYIFLEFFIIEQGKMWNTICDILKRKAQQGVLVRVLFDDIGCFVRVPANYAKTLREDGLECAVFNSFRPFISSKQNNRDHRKIVSIDGKFAFTGGINLADEYINAVDKFGHWKDAAVLVSGKAAWGFTVMFLQMWSFATNIAEDFINFYPYIKESCSVSGIGFIQPYADSPMDKENVGEHVYLQIINSAKKYVYINTPYLIPDDSLISALCLAAKSGVDVRIVTPHRWDKKLVHMTTRSYYRELLEAGVKIYEYTNGFLHSKTFVSDDAVATIGTTNLDFRSLYLHFECGTVIYNNPAVGQVKDDFVKTLELCQSITQEESKPNFFLHIFQAILRLFAPLM